MALTPDGAGLVEVVLLVGFGGVGVAIAVRGFGGLRTLVRMWTMRTADAMAAANRDGPIELEGVAEPEAGTLEAPFTGTDCLVYEYRIEEERTDGDGDTEWKRVAGGDRRVPFRLADDTGSVLVDPAGADLRLGRSDRIRVSGGSEPPERVRAFVARSDEVAPASGTVDLGVVSFRAGSTRRYVEHRLDPGESVYVLGGAEHDPTAADEGGEVNALVSGTGVRTFVVADGTERRAMLRIAGSVLVQVGVGVGTVGLVLAVWLG